MGAQVSTQVAMQTTNVVNQSMTNMVTKNASKANAVNVNANKISIDYNVEETDYSHLN